jgi:glycosyltransferase involved in cell wall biosynthesis
MERKRILILITNLSFGGAQRVFFEQSLLLSKEHDVIECVFNLADGHAFPTKNKIIDLQVPAGKNIFDKLIKLCQRVIRLNRLKKTLKTEICISHLEGADLINILSKNREKTVCWVHGSKLHDANIEGIIGWLRHTIIIPFIYQYADKVVTVSKAIQKELTVHYKIPSAKIETVYNFIDTEFARNASREEIEPLFQGIFSGDPILITSGRLARQKNHGSLILWFASFIKQRKCKLIIVGDGECRYQLIKLCEELNLKVFHPWSNFVCADHFQVYFLGFQENPFKYLRKSDVFILPSLWEGFPLVIGEAMACDLPILSADCPTGPRELLSRDSNKTVNEYEGSEFADFGILLPLLEPNRFAEWDKVVGQILDDSALRTFYAIRAADRVSAFSKQQFKEQLYRSIAI